MANGMAVGAAIVGMSDDKNGMEVDEGSREGQEDAEMEGDEEVVDVWDVDFETELAKI